MSLSVTVKGAKDLPNLESFGKSDPMCLIDFQGKKEQTDPVKGDLNPTWDKTFSFDVTEALQRDDQIHVEVYDWERAGGNKLMGQLDICLKRCVTSGSMDVTEALLNANGEPIDGKIELSLNYQAPAGGDGGDGGLSGGMPDVNFADDTGGDGGGGAPTADEAAGGAKAARGVVFGGTGPEGRKARQAMLARRKANRAALPKKPCDFQVRVHVIEGRKLSGADLNPVCNVRIHDQVQPTAAKKSTNAPLFDQIFFFSFHMAPNEFLDKIITLEVMNSKTLRSDAMVGSFQFDTGFCYDFENHTIAHKWLLLTNPVDLNSGPKGYLKISCQVLGPNDDIKPPPRVSSDTSDIEANLLRPSGTTLAPCTFNIRIYRMQDLPQMDSSLGQRAKNLVRLGSKKIYDLSDPYLEVTFAGNTKQSKVKYECYNPIFNEELCIGCQFPSMCDRVRLRVFDKDRFSPDTIGTAYLKLSEISAPGDTGFLPTFGPAWVNMYGSFREYATYNEYSYLDEGTLDGIAYRGRMLVEVTSEVGKFPETPKLPIEKDDVDRIERYFLLPRKYQLKAAFLEGTVLPADLAGSNISFELSVGNYGNSFDQSLPQTTSTSQAVRPVPYGEDKWFHYLPWGQSKPCVNVTCNFENIEDRVTSLNLLLGMCDRLEKNIARIRHMHAAQASKRETARAFIDLLDELMKDLKDEDQQIPKPTRRNPTVTRLDFLMYDIRSKEIEAILKDIESLRKSATDLVEAVVKVELFAIRLRGVAIEGQNSLPDVVISMLAGKKRVAYARVPAHEVLYAHDHKTDQKWKAASGRNCGRPQTIYLKWPPKDDGSPPDYAIACQLSVALWMGLAAHAGDWLRSTDEGEISVFAETYENQANYGLGWGTKGLFAPNFSNASASVALEKGGFQTPGGWSWEENQDWFINPELSASSAAGEAGKSEYMEDIYEYQHRIAGTEWAHSTISWGNVRGETLPGGREDIVCGEGWVWKDADWRLDKSRQCDEEGFQYTLDSSLLHYVAIERTYHLWRRRRWTRVRSRVATSKDKKKQDQNEEHTKEGWEYSHSFSGSFHIGKQNFDTCRRRRWHRKLVAIEESAIANPAFFFPDADKAEGGHIETPRMFMRFKEPHRYQLRVYLYQARNIRSADSTGLSDPYCRISFSHHYAKSVILPETIMPTWDQTLILDKIDLYGDMRIVAETPPDLVIELFDQDIIGKDEFLGRCIVKPYIRSKTPCPPPKLDWHPIKYFGKDAGELLAAFHLMVDEGDELPFAPERHTEKGKVSRGYMVPINIRPQVQAMRVEALCWGVRDLKRLQLLSVDKPYVVITAGETQLKTQPIKRMKKCPNYEQPLVIFDRVQLPRDELYMPPLGIQVFDNRAFGRTPLAGTHILIDMRSYKRDRFQSVPPRPQLRPANAKKALTEHVVEIPTAAAPGNGKPEPSMVIPNATAGSPTADASSSTALVPAAAKADDGGGGFFKKLKKKMKIGKKVDLEEQAEKFIDWWSKYYCSTDDPDQDVSEYLDFYEDLITIYDKPLEEVFGGFNDFLDTFLLFRGKGQRDNEDEANQSVGKFKGVFCIYPLPEDNSEDPPNVLSNTPASGEQKVVVRVYVIKGMSLQSQDAGGKNDPYLKVFLGNDCVVNDKKNYIPNTVDPVFGKLFQIKVSLPVEHMLKIQVMDWDLLSADDLVGETVIDLEDRFLTKHRATCGIPRSYCTDGTNRWRDTEKPTEILEQVCRRFGLDAPEYRGDATCVVADQVYELFTLDDKVAPDDELGPMRERLALKALHHFNIVPEHVETRPLYNPLRPSLPCGELHMWVDIFCEQKGKKLRAPVNISPRKPEEYELRVIIYNVEEIPLDDESITGEAMSDIYLKGWFQESDDKKHQTDVHYRSLDGEGNFNWRWIMPFKYIPAEKKMVINKKEHFYSWDKTEIRRPPSLVVQVWDNDLFSLDDYLGDVELNLCDMPPPTKTSKKCCPEQFQTLETKPKKDYVSLLESKSLKGWWPITGVDESGERIPAGKVEMELEILLKKEVEEKPAGEARDDPNTNPTLDPPNRPSTSFSWFSSPWKVFKFIIWRRLKKYILTGLILAIIGSIIALFIYVSPGYIVRKIFGISFK